MGFVHDDPEFDALLRIVAAQVGVQSSLVEKDYWVTHVLWWLAAAGFTVHFKGGTSLSKGFGLIQRFSEDLDLKLERSDLPEVSNWRSEEAGPKKARQLFFKQLHETLRIPGMEVRIESHHEAWRNVAFAAEYPGHYRRTVSRVGGGR